MATLFLPDQEVLIRAFGLDVDGVLRNTGMQIYEATCKAIEELGGIRPNFGDFLVAQDGKEEFRLFARCGAVGTDDQIHTSYLKHVPEHDIEPPFEDVMDFLLMLIAKGVRPFVVSRHPTDKLTTWFQGHDLHRHVERLQGSSTNKALHIREICEHLDVPPSAACYAGDWGNDMRAAVWAGVVPIGITRKYETRQILLNAGAQCVVDDLKDLTEMIR